ncbi:hypothetical protein [Pontiella agarivorans]|uniref:Cell division protein FtsL n=1 Tax=Pontiella agarivorans TaxID=3038953 RepID=A0ABU5MSJ4_9BACT|nr:hypothetical protein [Pontiella agarivorans]MDZ8117116.1 hypothetical protein [Pontiella agarivorans]
MAAKKRKTTKRKMKQNQVQVPFPVLLANVLVLVAVMGLSYMWLCSRCDALGRDIKAKEAELAQAQKRLVNEQDRWSTITSPANLERAIKRHRLKMSMPELNRVVEVGHWDVTARTAMNGGSRRSVQ